MNPSRADPNADDALLLRRQRRRRQYRLSSLILVVALVAVGMGLLRMPGVGFLVLAILAGLGMTLGILLGAMALGWLGCGLFALFDRLVHWSRKEPEWFQPTWNPPPADRDPF